MIDFIVVFGALWLVGRETQPPRWHTIDFLGVFRPERVLGAKIKSFYFNAVAVCRQKFSSPIESANGVTSTWRIGDG
jgi:hypothetical protein